MMSVHVSHQKIEDGHIHEVKDHSAFVVGTRLPVIKIQNRFVFLRSLFNFKLCFKSIYLFSYISVLCLFIWLVIFLFQNNLFVQLFFLLYVSLFGQLYFCFMSIYLFSFISFLCFFICFVIQWAPLNGITDNRIKRLMGSNLSLLTNPKVPFPS